MGLKIRRCSCCGCYFHPDPRVKNQRFCGKRKCQQARKNKWQRQKIVDDPEYRADKDDSQRSWLDRTPDYWKQYRLNNPDYTERNRQLQRERDSKRRKVSEKNPADEGNLAKRDALDSFLDANTMRYLLLPAESNLAKKDAIMVKIIPISPG